MKFSASFVLASVVAVLGVTSILAAPAPQRSQRGLGRSRGQGRAGGFRRAGRVGGRRQFRGAGGGGVEQRDFHEDDLSLRDVADSDLANYVRSMQDEELALGLRAAIDESDLEARKINWGKIGRGALKVGKFAASNFLKRDEEVEARDLTEEDFDARDLTEEELEARKINWGKIGRGALKVGKFAASNFLKRDEEIDARDLTEEELEARKINWGKVGRGALKVGKFAASNFLKRDELPLEARDLTEEELEERKINWGKIGRGALKVGKFAASNFLKRDVDDEIDIRDVSDADLAMVVRSLPDEDLAVAVRETFEELSPLERRKFKFGKLKKFASGALKVGKMAASSGLF